jgi:hypothetical protein
MNRGQRRAQWLTRNRMRSKGLTDHGNMQHGNTKVSLHIAELVLHGFPLTSRHSIGDATQQELLRLITNRGLPLRGAQGDLSRIDGGSFPATPATKPDAIGRLIAQAIHGGRRP